MRIRTGIAFGVKYEIVGPSGARAVINDPTDPDHVGFTAGDDAVTGLERAGVRGAGEDVPEGDGRRAGPSYYEGIAFTLRANLTPDLVASQAPQDKILEATDAMDADSRLAWTPPGGVPVMLDFRQQLPTRITGRRPKQAFVAGVAEKSVVLTQAETETDILAVATTPGGFTSPLTSPLRSNPSNDGQATIENRGRSKTWPILEIHGPCVNPVITNITNGARALYFTYTLAAGQRLVIYTDPRRRAVLLDDQAGRYDALDFDRSSWWALLPGNNDLRIAFTSFSAGAKVRVRHRDAWG